MGSIVGAFAMSHQLGAPDGVEVQAERAFAGMREVGRRIRALSPSLIVIISSDHLNNFSLEQPAPFAIAIAGEFTPLGDMGLPRDPVPGAPDFATALLSYAQAQGIAIGAADPVMPDHGVMIPLGIVDPRREIPAVPLYVNTVFYPEPGPRDSARLGAVLRAFVEQETPDDARVVLLGAGGLSHWVGMPQEGQINMPWDRDFLDDMLTGDLEALVARDNGEILAVAGNGGLEINAWIVAAAMPGARGECLFYEAIPQWATGMAGVELHAA